MRKATSSQTSGWGWNRNGSTAASTRISLPIWAGSVPAPATNPAQMGERLTGGGVGAEAPPEPPPSRLGAAAGRSTSSLRNLWLRSETQLAKKWNVGRAAM